MSQLKSSTSRTAMEEKVSTRRVVSSFLLEFSSATKEPLRIADNRPTPVPVLYWCVKSQPRMRKAQPAERLITQTVGNRATNSNFLDDDAVRVAVDPLETRDIFGSSSNVGAKR